MPISSFPTSLQPLIQQGFLERSFQNGLESRLGFRSIADKETFPNRIGETITKTRKGLKAPVTTPLTPTSNSNFDNGLTPTPWAVEQYTLGINMYGDTIDLNMVTERVGIASQFLANAVTNGKQAMQTRDRLARDALYSGYLGGNTRVRTALGGAAATVAVDDVRGFSTVFAGSLMVPVSVSSPLAVTVNGNPYSVIGVTNDGTNVSTAPKGVSGVLTFSGNVLQADGALAAPVVSVTAPLVLRPNGRATSASLQAGDTLTMQEILAGVARMRMNNVPTINGLYHMYLDDQQMLGLFQDPQFQILFRGAYQSNEYSQAQVIELLGVRYITTTEAPQQGSLGAGPIRRGMLVGQGALIEGSFEGIGASDIPLNTDIDMMTMVDGVAMITREPMDRLRQIIAQSWYWIGGYTLPSDVTATQSIIPTSSSSYYKRCVVIESL